MSQSLDRGLTVLAELSRGDRTLDQLAETVSVHKSTVLRLLRTLETHRFVQRVDIRHYRLGTALFGLANRALEDRDVRRAVEPALRRLNEITGHTVHLACHEAGEVIYIDKYDGRHSVRMYSRVGRSAPLHCTAVAKVLFAELPSDRIRLIMAGMAFPRLTANTITDPDAYLTELARVRTVGYAVDNAEHEDFMHCVAAPVRGPDGAVTAAVSISVPRMILDLEGLLALVPDLTRACAAASEACGWTAPAAHVST